MIPQVAMAIGEAIIDRFTCPENVKEAFRRYFHHVFNDPLITPRGIL